MEGIVEAVNEGDEGKVKEALKAFCEKNASNFKIGESIEIRKTFCSVLLSRFSSLSWSSETTVEALGALKIFTRESEGSLQLTSSSGLAILIHLAGLDRDFAEMKEFFGGQDALLGEVNVKVEAVKCLCNLVLKNHHLSNTVSELGCLGGLRARLTYSASYFVPYDIRFFDLRLLFLITACGQEQRVKLRDELDGLSMLVTLLDSVLFTPTSEQAKEKGGVVKEGAEESRDNANSPKREEPAEGIKALQDKRTHPTPETTTTRGGESIAMEGEGEVEEVKSKESKSKSKAHGREDVWVLPCVLQDNMCMVLSECLKIIFNQTVHWKEEEMLDDDELDTLYWLAHLLRIMICSIPPNQGTTSMLTINHCCEVIMNLPRQCHHIFALPSEATITPKLNELYPHLFQEAPDKEATPEIPFYYDLDQQHCNHNMAVAICLLNYLITRLLKVERDRVDNHGLSIALGTMSLLCKGNRVLRKYLKTQVLPPMGEVKERPENEQSLKGKLVKLMTAGSHDLMDMVAEFLFVLCKESATRLVKHTGYGNAAGLLMSHGLLGGGGKVQRQEEYSSDSEDSDTEEYKKSKGSVDPVTGGPVKEKKESLLDHMTQEEIEIEAEKLGQLFEQLQQRGDFKLVPVDKDNNPVKFPERREEGGHSSEED